MPEKDDRSEKQTRTSVGIGNTEINRETKTTASDQSSSAGGGGASYERDRYSTERGSSGGRGGASYERERYDRGGGGYQEGPYDDEPEDYGDRARRGARDLGESVRDTSRTVRRESTNLLTAGCDLIGGFFIGLGEAISPRSRSGGGSSRSYGNCGQVTSVCGGGQYEDEGPQFNYPSRRPANWNEPPQRPANWNEPPQRPEYNRSGGGGGYVKTKSTEYSRTSR